MEVNRLEDVALNYKEALLEVTRLASINEEALLEVTRLASINEEALLEVTRLASINEVCRSELANSEEKVLRLQASIEELSTSIPGAANLENKILEKDGTTLKVHANISAMSINNVGDVTGKLLARLMPECDHLELGDAVDRIEDQTFKNWPGLLSVRFSKSLTMIGSYAFSCAGERSTAKLGKVIIPKSVAYIGADAFGGRASEVAFEVGNMSALVINQYAFQGMVFPNGLDLPVHTKIIGPGAFQSVTVSEVASIVLPPDISELGAHAFRGLKGRFTSIDASKCTSLTELGDYSFRDINSLKSIALPPRLQHIPRELCADCKELEAVSIPPGVVNIGYMAFKNCVAVETLAFEDPVSNTAVSTETPTSLGAIADYAFQNMKSLKHISIPSNRFRSIGMSAFSMTIVTNVVLERTVSIGDGVVSIGDKAFGAPYEPYQTLELDWSGNRTLVSIGISCFKNSIFTAPGGLVLPPGLVSIGDRAFEGCSAATLILNENLASIGTQCFSSFKVSGPDPVLRIPASVETILRGAFSNSTFQEVSIADGSGLKKIEAYALGLKYRAGTSVKVPASTELVDKAFGYGKTPRVERSVA